MVCTIAGTEVPTRRHRSTIIAVLAVLVSTGLAIYGIVTGDGTPQASYNTLPLVTAARSQAIATLPTQVPLEQQARSEDAPTHGLTKLLAITENYPQLRSDGTFRDLHYQLVETEDRIAAAYRLYNLEVAAYERRRQTVPSNVIASAAGSDPQQMFEIRDPATERAPPVMS